MLEKTCHFCKINKSENFIYDIKLDHDGKFFPYLPVCNNCKIEYDNIWRNFIHPIIRNAVLELSKGCDKGGLMKNKNNITYEVWGRGFQEDPTLYAEYADKKEAKKHKKKLENKHLLMEFIIVPSKK